MGAGFLSNLVVPGLFWSASPPTWERPAAVHCAASQAPVPARSRQGLQKGPSSRGSGGLRGAGVLLPGGGVRTGWLSPVSSAVRLCAGQCAVYTGRFPKVSGPPGWDLAAELRCGFRGRGAQVRPLAGRQGGAGRGGHIRVSLRRGAGRGGPWRPRSCPKTFLCAAGAESPALWTASGEWRGSRVSLQSPSSYSPRGRRRMRPGRKDTAPRRLVLLLLQGKRRLRSAGVAGGTGPGDLRSDSTWTQAPSHPRRDGETFIPSAAPGVPTEEGLTVC